MAYRATTNPFGIAKNSFVKLNKFIFLVDFIIMDIKEEPNIPLILGRSFMKSEWMLICIDKGSMKVGIKDDDICFRLFEIM